MIKNYLKAAWRSLLKNRLFTFLNILGLASGLSIALLLMLYVKDELSFDTWNTKAKRIYRVNVTATFDGKSQQWANSPNVVGPAMKENIPDVEEQVRLLYHNYGQTAFVNSDENKFTEKKLFWADNSIFKIFDIHLEKGNPATALDRPNTIVLSETTAGKYFGRNNPLGKILKIDNKYDAEVTGVYKDLPGNSTLDANMIGSFNSIEWASKNLVWSNASYETYLLLKPGASIEKIDKQMQAILDKNVSKKDQWFSLWLQPLTKIHLDSASISNASTTRIGDAKQVKIMTILAMVVLLIAAINYMNLSTAKSQLRFKEVSINKAVGASFMQLAGRFYLETALLILISFILAFLLVLAGLPILNNLADKSLSVSSIFSGDIMSWIAIVGMVMLLIAGSYPAFYLSSFRPKELLHTTFRKNSGAGIFRRSLVVLQFSASVILIICTIIFYKQLWFIQTKKLGYQPEQVVAINTFAAQDKQQMDALINNCRKLNGVVNVCRAQTWPGFGGSGRTLSKAGNLETGMFIRTNRVSNEFPEVLGIKLLAGTTFRSERPEGDTTVQVVLNKTAVDFLGYTPGEAISKKAYNLFGTDRAEIVGVMEDFNFESLHQPIGAYAFHNNNSEWRPYLLVKMQTHNLPATMNQLEEVFHKSLPNSAFEYTFLDQYLNTLYKAEQRTAKIVLLFASLAILIACLGLFGLAAFTAEQRTKEIGVRKVLGASVPGIATLLSKDFLKLVLISIAIASPLAWYAMHKWLQDFAYRINISWKIFAAAGIIALLIALITVSFQAIKAAIANPVKSLRTE
jgi:putative ABC transport system permease protein